MLKALKYLLLLAAICLQQMAHAHTPGMRQRVLESANEPSATTSAGTTRIVARESSGFGGSIREPNTRLNP